MQQAFFTGHPKEGREQERAGKWQKVGRTAHGL